jgi:large-conductance mechanosensitive channel
MGSVPVATVGSVVGGAASSIIDTIGDGIIYTVVTSLTGVEEDHLAYWLIHSVARTLPTELPSTLGDTVASLINSLTTCIITGAPDRLRAGSTSNVAKVQEVAAHVL